MTDDERPPDALRTAQNCYLSTLLAAANALAEACPEVGGIYRHRLTRLRARLAFDSSPAALEESCGAVEAELKEFGTRTAAYVETQSGELRAALAAMAEIVNSLMQRQEFYGARLRQFARQMESADYPSEADQLQEIIALQAAGLASCVESMNHEAQSLAMRAKQELTAVELRIEASAMTDPLTGLMNRTEMDRRIEAAKAGGAAPVLLQFHLTGAVTPEVMRQVAARLASQFRHKDFLARWNETDFMVLFQGPAEIARSRSERIVPWIAGRYVTEGGESVEIGVVVMMHEPALAV